MLSEDVTYLDHGVGEINLKFRHIGSRFAKRRQPDVEAIYLPLHLCSFLVQ